MRSNSTGKDFTNSGNLIQSELLIELGRTVPMFSADVEQLSYLNSFQLFFSAYLYFIIFTNWDAANIVLLAELF